MMHTKGPWSMEVNPVQNGYIFSFYANGLLLGEMYGSTNAMWDFVPGAKEGEANAHRLIALMNSFDGISTEDIEGAQKKQDWSNAPPKEDGCYWLRRDGKEDTIVEIWNSTEGMVEFGAMVSWLGSDWSLSLCDVVKERGCLWLGPIPHPDASSSRR